MFINIIRQFLVYGYWTNIRPDTELGIRTDTGYRKNPRISGPSLLNMDLKSSLYGVNSDKKKFYYMLYIFPCLKINHKGMEWKGIRTQCPICDKLPVDIKNHIRLVFYPLLVGSHKPCRQCDVVSCCCCLWPADFSIVTCLFRVFLANSLSTI